MLRIRISRCSTSRQGALTLLPRIIIAGPAPTCMQCYMQQQCGTNTFPLESNSSHSLLLHPTCITLSPPFSLTRSWTVENRKEVRRTRSTQQCLPCPMLPRWRTRLGSMPACRWSHLPILRQGTPYTAQPAHVSPPERRLLALFGTPNPYHYNSTIRFVHH